MIFITQELDALAIRVESSLLLCFLFTVIHHYTYCSFCGFCNELILSGNPVVFQHDCNTTWGKGET